jgi:hypothetical protein
MSEVIWAVWLPEKRQPARRDDGAMWAAPERRRAEVRAEQLGGVVIDALWLAEHLHEAMDGRADVARESVRQLRETIAPPWPEESEPARSLIAEAGAELEATLWTIYRHSVLCRYCSRRPEEGHLGSCELRRRGVLVERLRRHLEAGDTA